MILRLRLAFYVIAFLVKNLKLPAKNNFLLSLQVANLNKIKLNRSSPKVSVIVLLKCILEISWYKRGPSDASFLKLRLLSSEWTANLNSGKPVLGWRVSFDQEGSSYAGYVKENLFTIKYLPGFHQLFVVKDVFRHSLRCFPASAANT